jgi:hypothetical protein
VTTTVPDRLAVPHSFSVDTGRTLWVSIVGF